MRLVQYRDTKGRPRVAVVGEGGTVLHPIGDAPGLYDLALEAASTERALAEMIGERVLHDSDQAEDYDAVVGEKRLLPPITHPDPAHTIVAGTGLTHFSGAAARQELLGNTLDCGEDVTETMRMFKWGMEGGRPPPGEVGVQPHWFYKGDGSTIVASGEPLILPDYALGGNEEAEIVGIYINNAEGMPCRIGFALGNDFSDHAMERQNTRYLGHSKLRACALGPEILLGNLPPHIVGRSRVLRGEKTIWEGDFVTGEDNMSHHLANLEYHHFKYPQFRRPGDVHCHFFGASALSSSDGVRTESGDVFEIACAVFGRRLSNPMVQGALPAIAVRML